MKVRAPSQDSRSSSTSRSSYRARASRPCARRRAARTSRSAGGRAPRRSRSWATPVRAPAGTATSTGRPEHAPDPLEPLRLAQAAATLGAKHVVVTSVDRDDLPDRGAGHFAATIRALKARLPDCSVEVLTPDFLGVEEQALATVLGARPEVFNHNIETVRSLHRRMRGAKAELRPGAVAPAPGGQEVADYPVLTKLGDHRRARRDQRRGRGDDARPARRTRSTSSRSASTCSRRSKHAGDRPLGAPRRVPAGCASRARRSGSGRSSRDRSCGRATARTSRSTRPTRVAARSRTRLPAWLSRTRFWLAAPGSREDEAGARRRGERDRPRVRQHGGRHVHRTAPRRRRPLRRRPAPARALSRPRPRVPQLRYGASQARIVAVSMRVEST